MWYLYLSEPPFSHFETVCLTTFSFAASSSWERPFAFLALLMFSFNMICASFDALILTAKEPSPQATDVNTGRFPATRRKITCVPLAATPSHSLFRRWPRPDPRFGFGNLPVHKTGSPGCSSDRHSGVIPAFLLSGSPAEIFQCLVTVLSQQQKCLRYIRRTAPRSPEFLRPFHRHRPPLGAAAPLPAPGFLSNIHRI